MKPTATIPIAVILFMFSSCNQKTTASIASKSPDGNVTVNVAGHRSSSVDPWMVVIKVKAYNFKEGKLEFENYIDDLNDQTVKFDWQDNNHCVMTFQVRDDKPRQFQLIATADQVQMAEIGNDAH